MRITITVDVDPSEYPQAHALIEALRTVTADLKVNGSGVPRGGVAPGRSPPHLPSARDRGSPASSAGGTVGSAGGTPAPAATAAAATAGATNAERQAGPRGAGAGTGAGTGPEAAGATPRPGFAAGFETQTGSGTSGHSGGSGSGSGSAGSASGATAASLLAPALEPEHPLAGVQGFYRETLMAIRDVTANIPELIHGINVVRETNPAPQHAAQYGHGP